MIGEILGNRYKLLRDLGSGGMAWVYLAEDSLEGGAVAVKVLYPQFSLDMAYLQRFVREAKVASGLTSPHIVKVLDYGATRDVHYLVMEYIDGRDLKDVLLDRGRLPWREALSTARQICLALDHAFQFGIVHRDIKPQNLMIADGGVVKVLDFGIARALTMPSLTLTGFVGSPYYISPEQAKGEQVDIRSDIYSLGVVLFEILTGRVPFDADNPWAIISQHIEKAPPSLLEANADIPPEVENLVLTALAKSREDRFQTPLQMMNVMDSLLADDEGSQDSDDQLGLVRQKGLEETYARALEAAEEDQWVQASNLLSYVVRLDPAFRDAASRLSNAETELKLQNLYDSALDSIGAGQWAPAVTVLKTIVSLEPEYKDASALLEQAQAALTEPAVEQVEFSLPAAVGPARSTESISVENHPVPDVVPAKDALVVALDGAAQDTVRRSGHEASGTPASSRRWLLGVLLVILLGSVFIIGGLELIGRQREQSIQARYARAVDLYGAGNLEEAIREFDRVLAMAPDYEGAASKREEAVEKRDLEQLYNEGLAQFESGNFAEAITVFSELRSRDLAFRQSSIDDMLCDAYYGQSEKLSQEIDVKSLQGAIALLDKALEICPTDTDVLSEKKTLGDYLQIAVDLGDGQWNQVFEKLTVLGQTETNEPDSRFNRLYYRVYLEFGQKREEEGNIAAALLHYNKALSVPGVDHSQLEKKIADLGVQLVLLSPTPNPQTPAVEPPIPTAVVTPAPSPTAVAQGISPSRETTVVRYYGAPRLMSPPDGTIFTSGEFEKLVLEWEGPEELAEDEYYDVTVLHFFNEQEVYWGTNTRDTHLELSPTIGYGRADKDVFHWFVTIRRAERVDSEGKPDGPPISLRSDAWTFFWR